MRFLHKPILTGAAALALIFSVTPRAPARVQENMPPTATQLKDIRDANATVTPVIYPGIAQTAAWNNWNRNLWLLRRQMLINQLAFNRFVYGNAFGPNAAYYSLLYNNLYNNSLNQVLRLNRLIYGSNFYPYAAYMYGGYPMTGGYNYNYSSPPTYQPSPYSYMGYYPSFGSAAAAEPATKSIPHYTPEPNPSFARKDIFEVQIHDVSLSHKEITIPVGTTVEWTNAGRHPHTVAADDGTWQTTLQPDQSFSFKFTQPGTHRYRVDAKSNKIDGEIVVKKK